MYKNNRKIIIQLLYNIIV